MNYRLGKWRVLSEQNSLSNSTEVKHLDNKSMQVLLLLIKQAGEPVTKECLLDAIWPDKAVSDDILSVAVSNIRKALDDNARSPTYIKTLPKIGYCLIHAVTVEDVAPISIEQEKPHLDSTVSDRESKLIRHTPHVSHLTPNTPDSISQYVYLLLLVIFTPLLILLVHVLSLPSVTTAQLNKANDNVIASTGLVTDREAIVVSTFQYFGKDIAGKHFTSGLVETLVNDLQNKHAMKVLPLFFNSNSNSNQNSNQSIQKNQKSLSVRWVVTGSVQQVGSRVRVIIRLVDNLEEHVIWSESFDRNINQVFKTQDEVSLALSNALKR